VDWTAGVARVLSCPQIFTDFHQRDKEIRCALSTQHIPIGFHPAHTMDESLCARIERAKKRAVHRHRLATMTSSVDSSCPRSQLRGRRKNPKKAQLDEDRFALIERENRLMLISMSKIMLRQPIKKHPSHVRSLNLQQRQRDMKRINYDNQLLLSRIEKTTPYCK
jgi:hypothetical protein